MLLDFSEVVRNGVQTFSSIFHNQDRQQSVPDDDSPTSNTPSLPARSNASTTTSHRVQMPRPGPKFRTKTLSAHLESQDNPPAPVTCVPINVDSDDEDETRDRKQETFNSGAREPDQSQQISNKPQRVTKRDEARVVGGLVRTSIARVEDTTAMKSRSFKASLGGHRPIDTLGNSKSAFYLERTAGGRLPPFTPVVHKQAPKQSSKNEIRDNDHSTPHKKRKTEDSRQPGHSAASAISLDDSQARDESEDELALNSKPQIQPAPVDRQSSPSDEGIFTKGSARQRKAEKDQMLESSPIALGQPKTGHTSPYFGVDAPRIESDATVPKRNGHARSVPESPDALQSEETRPSRGRKEPSLGKVRTATLGALIVGNDSSISITKGSQSRDKKTANPGFELLDAFHATLVTGSRYILEVDKSRKQFSLFAPESLVPDQPVMSRQISKVAKLDYGAESDPVVSLEFSRSGSSQDKIFLRFVSQKPALNFVLEIQKICPQMKMKGRPDGWMEPALSNYKSDCRITEDRARSRNANTVDRPSARPRSPTPTRPNTGQKRVRQVDKLDPPTSLSSQSTIITGADRRAEGLGTHHARRPAPRPAPSDFSLTQDTSGPGFPPRRITRSQDEYEHTTSSLKRREASPKIKVSETGALGPPWSKDLIYPQPGRRAAIVPFEDLARLDDDEFLNDNLISFFMRYLETHMEKNNPEVYKRMHFFNTYFYEALTKTPKGKKGLNYDAVKRWTKNINLFSRDFVVVPVNENLHWYVAIICNLPFFAGGSGSSGWSENTTEVGQESEESEQEDDPPTAETQQSLADLSITDDREVDRTTTKIKGPGRRKRVRRSLPKYDVSKPVIITLDSLGHARSSTCSQLRQYVAMEGKDKKGLDIEPTDLRGMTAKELPTQSNFSDCGLFVCVYLEQFVADPYAFVQRILQRHASAQQWPRRIQSENLRSRLRDLILETHRKQENEPSQMEEPAIGKILIDKRELSPTPPPMIQEQLEPSPCASPPMKAPYIRDAKRRFKRMTQAPNDEAQFPHGPETTRQNPLASAHEMLTALEADSNSPTDFNSEDDDHVTTDEGRTQYNNRQSPRQAIVRQSATRTPMASDPVVEVHVPASPREARHSPRNRAHSEPSELAEKMRKGRAEVDSKKRRRLFENEKSPKKSRRSRSPSRTSQLTEELTSGEQGYLKGITTFAAEPSASPTTTTANQANGRVFRVGSNVDRIEESPLSSPEPEVVGERIITPRIQAQKLTERKWTPGKKVQAPETAEDLARLKFNGFDNEAEVEVPESQEAQREHQQATPGRRGAKRRQAGANEREMLF